MTGTTAHSEGITYPPIDDLLNKVPSKYALVIYAAKRARQINTYYQQVADGMYTTPGPLLDTEPDEKPLSISLREINEGLLEFRDGDEVAEEQADLPVGISAGILPEEDLEEPGADELAEIEAALAEDD